MKLVTRQSLDFDITKDLVDLTKSEYFYDDWGEVFKKSYNWLFNSLGYDKFIWCYPESSNLPRTHGQEFIQWHLEVPLEECFFINEEIWNLIINDMPYFKEMNDSLPDEEYDKLYESYKKIKEETWKENIFKYKDISETQVLIKSPVLEKYVINKFWCSSYDLEEFNSGITRSSFRTEDKALKFKEIIESGLRGRKIPFTSKIEKNNYGFILEVDWESKDERRIHQET